MRSVRSLVVVATTIFAFSVLASSVSAASPKNFHLNKTCVSNFLCTVVTSDFKAIPAGTDITYTVTGDGSDGLAYPTIVVRNGSTTGVCDWNQPAGPVLAKCTFGTGTGRLTQFHLAVDVTFDGTYWFWDGTYWFGNGD
jgi:hypothetical protein